MAIENNELCLIKQQILTDIADAIRAKSNTETSYYPKDMPDAIDAISAEGIIPTGSVNITSNGTHDVTNYASAIVNVSGGAAEYTITYPTNLSHQHIYISKINNDINSEGVYNLKPSGINIGLDVDSGYNAGHLIINNVDSESTMYTVNPVSQNLIITVTEATMKTYDNVILDAVLEPAFSSDSSYPSGSFWFGYSNGSSSWDFGELTPNTFTYNSDTVEVYQFYLNGSSNYPRLNFVLRGSYYDLSCIIKVGDPSTSNYWVLNVENGSLIRPDTATTIEILSYFVDCANNGTSVPFKIAV